VSNGHIPVLADSLAENIQIKPDAVIVDATIGYAGHSLRLAERFLGKEGVIIGLDVDQACLDYSRDLLSTLDCRVILEKTNFVNINNVVRDKGFEKVDFVLADLGWCSAQLDDKNRGLSFQSNMPLDMRLDSALSTTAEDIVNKYDRDQLADLIYRFGEERLPRKIASAIEDFRRVQPIKTTGQLAVIIDRALGGRFGSGRSGRIHPATKTFQALRIAVNHELDNLEKLLKLVPEILGREGYFAVISFHSLEDRLVKQDFRQKAKNGEYFLVNKKPITASDAEVKANARSRSAKLRIAMKN
jgi:16S rRNA (cytosine1402-N4)-methyltransferase